jgi:hypothetical protein
LPPPTPGVANDKYVDIREGKEGGVEISTARAKTASKPAKAVNTVVSKKAARRAISAIRKHVGSYRKDLASAAVARTSAVHRALRAKGVKKN